MPPPRVNYKDLPKATRDRIDRDHGKKESPGMSKKEKEALRIKQVVENIKDKQRAEEQGTTAKDFKEMKKRQDAERKEKEKSPVVSKAEKAKNWIQERGRAIAHETRDIRPRGSVHGAMGMGLPANPDLFGVGSFGGGGGMKGMMGADPFQEMYPRRNPQPAPQRKRKRKTKRRVSRPAPAPSMGMMGGIPSHMKWMFGQ